MSTRKPVVITDEKINEEDLFDLVADIEKLTGTVIAINKQFTLTCETAAIEKAFEALYAAVVASDSPRPVRNTKRGAMISVGAGSLQAQANAKSWRLLDAAGNVVERLTVEEKNRRLNLGEFTEGAILHHPKAGRQVITGAPGSGQGMQPAA